jgi:hypothetical protein
MSSNNRYGEFQDEEIANKNISLNEINKEPHQVSSAKPKFLQKAMENKDIIVLNMATGGNATEKAQTNLMISINTHLR